MAEDCPHLEYRRKAREATFESDRPFCTVTSRFVEPMRADICNGRYDLAHGTDCEIFRRHERA